MLSRVLKHAGDFFDDVDWVPFGVWSIVCVIIICASILVFKIIPEEVERIKEERCGSFSHMPYSEILPNCVAYVVEKRGLGPDILQKEECGPFSDLPSSQVPAKCLAYFANRR